MICSNHIHGGCSDLATSPIFNSTACQSSSPMIWCDSYRSQKFWSQFVDGCYFLTKNVCVRGSNKGQCIVYNHCLELYTKVTCQVFTFYLCPHREDQHHSDTHFFFSFTLMFQAQHYFRHFKYIIWGIFKNLKMHLALLDSAFI